jgi:hypothetical protein
MSATVEREWEISLPASNAEELLAALACRDRLFGHSMTLEPDEQPDNAVEAWIASTEMLDGNTVRLGVYVELTGPKAFLDAASEAVEEVVSEHVEAGAADASRATLLARRPVAEVEFRAVAECDERPQLIIPDWLGPEQAELPWSFRSFDRRGDPWPDDALLSSHERVALVPFDHELLLFALPAVEDGDESQPDT